MFDGNSDDTIRLILNTTRRIAMIGASAKPWRPSHDVMRFLLDRGYDVIPVNPGLSGHAIHGRGVVGSLADAAPLDMVDVFRNSTHVEGLVDQVIQLGARTIWMQLGVVDEKAATKARDAGIPSSWIAARSSRIAALDRSVGRLPNLVELPARDDCPPLNRTRIGATFALQAAVFTTLRGRA